MRYDSEPAKRILGLSETREMQAQRRRVLELLAPAPGWEVLEVGCGPGHLAQEIAAAVGSAGHVVGADVSDEMLALAAQDPVELVKLEDSRLPFADGRFDAAVATQVYEFVEDLAGALSELIRVLRPGASAVILDTDWDSLVWHSHNRGRMDRVLAAWQERVAHPHLPRTLSRRLREAGFEIAHRETLAIFDPDGSEGSYSALQIEHLGASADAVPAAEVAAWAEDLRELARTGDYFFSVNRYIFLAAKPSAQRQRRRAETA